jgi:hypothetical protein
MDVWEATKVTAIPQNVKLITSTWAMKKKSNGTFRARVNARGFMQVPGEHFNSDSISSPVTNEATIRVVMVLSVVFGWANQLVDVKGAFLCGNFQEEKPIYMKVPEGFESYYAEGMVLRLMKTIYGLKQAARAFWRELTAALADMRYSQSPADPCLYFCWTMKGLIIWLSWIDDCLIAGNHDGVELAKEQMKQRFDCDDVGELKEYVGCKIERSEKAIRFTQPVLLQSFEDEFQCKEGKVTIPAEAGSVLEKCAENEALTEGEQTRYRSGVGKLLHMMRWSRPEIYNAVRELSRFMTIGASSIHMKAMERVMNYCLTTRNRGLLIEPTQEWDGSPEFEVLILGRSDSDYAKDPETRKSISGTSTFLCGAPIIQRSTMQKIVALSVTEAELIAATSNAQDMMYVKRLLESMSLRVKLPMILEVDNKGAVDLINNYSVGGRTRHMETRQYYLHELKEKNIMVVKWKAGAENSSDMFTKNLHKKEFNKHAAVYVGVDEYMGQL